MFESASLVVVVLALLTAGVGGFLWLLGGVTESIDSLLENHASGPFLDSHDVRLGSEELTSR